MSNSTSMTRDEFDRAVTVHSKKVTRKNYAKTLDILRARGGIHADFDTLGYVTVTFPSIPTRMQLKHIEPFKASVEHILRNGPPPTPYKSRKDKAQKTLPFNPPSGGNGVKKVPVPAPEMLPVSKRVMEPMKRLSYRSMEERTEALIEAAWAINGNLNRLAQLLSNYLGVPMPPPMRRTASKAEEAAASKN